MQNLRPARGARLGAGTRRKGATLMLGNMRPVVLLVALALRPAGSELQDGADRVAERVSSTGGRIHVQYCMS